MKTINTKFITNSSTVSIVSILKSEDIEKFIDNINSLYPRYCLLLDITIDINDIINFFNRITALNKENHKYIYINYDDTDCEKFNILNLFLDWWLNSHNIPYDIPECKEYTSIYKILIPEHELEEKHNQLLSDNNIVMVKFSAYSLYDDITKCVQFIKTAIKELNTLVRDSQLIFVPDDNINITNYINMFKIESSINSRNQMILNIKNKLNSKDSIKVVIDSFRRNNSIHYSFEMDINKIMRLKSFYDNFTLFRRNLNLTMIEPVIFDTHTKKFIKKIISDNAKEYLIDDIISIEIYDNIFKVVQKDTEFRNV